MSTIMEKTNILRKEFLELEINHDEYLTQAQLLGALDRKARKEFDRDVALQLYDHMNCDHKGRVTVDEFVKVWLQAEEILKNKIESCKKCLQDYHRQRKEAVVRQEEARMEERLNQYGVMEGSNLQVTLINGEGFPGNLFYVHLQLGEQEYQTDHQKGPSPTWNKTTNFIIETGLEELQIFVVSPTHQQSPMLIGTLTISLSHLSNQKKLEEFHNLYDKQGQLTPYRLRLGLQWLHSKTKFLNEVVERWNESIQQQEDDLLDFERDLATLYEPFPSLIKILQQLKPANNSELAVNKQPKNVYVNTPVTLPNNQSSDLTTIARALTIAILIFTLIGSFMKPEFISFLACFYFIVCYERNLMTRQNLINAWAGFAFSAVMDVAWLIKYSSNWWDMNNQRGDLSISPQLSLLRVVVVMVYFQLLAKILNLAALGIIAQRIGYVDIPSKNEKDYGGHAVDINNTTLPHPF